MSLNKDTSGKTKKFGLNFSDSVQFVSSTYKTTSTFFILITVSYNNMIIPQAANNKMNNKDSTLIKNATKKLKDCRKTIMVNAYSKTM